MVISIVRPPSKVTCKHQITFLVIGKRLLLHFANSLSVAIFIQHFLKDSRRGKNLQISIKCYYLDRGEGDIIITLVLRYIFKDRPLFSPLHGLLFSLGNYPPFHYFVFTSAAKLQNVSIQILFF